MEKKSSWPEVAAYFLKLGIFGFGGPLALIGAMQRDLVKKRGWLAEEHFNRALALIKAMPGPIAPQMAIYMGRERAGSFAGLVAGICLVLPAFITMLLLAAFYTRVARASWMETTLFGMQSAAIGVILASVWGIATPYRHNLVFLIVVVAAAAITTIKASLEPLVIIGFGILGAISLIGHPNAHNDSTPDARPHSTRTADGEERIDKGSRHASTLTAVIILTLTALAGTFSLGALKSSLLTSLAGVSLKSGAFVFGSGLAIVPLLIHDVVEVHHWLTHRQFMDALALGQITPGPVIITVTFIGYRVAGFLGALVATAGVFLPAFFNMLTWFPYAENRISSSRRTPVFVMWAIGAVVGSIFATVAKLLIAPPEGGTYLTSGLLATAALGAALFTRLPAWTVIPLGGVIGGCMGLLHF